MSYKKWLCAGISVASIIGAPQVSAQPESPAAGVAEEVIVTARRREEKLQDVPISVTAISGAALERSHVDNIQALQTKVPGLSITNATSNRNAVQFAIRGQRTNETQQLTDPPVGYYFAEVVQPRNWGFGQMLYDLESVQVLKGVQGTLFGRNVTGGAVLVEPQHPKDEWEALIKGEMGNYNMWSTYGMINVPLVKDKLAIRLNGKIHQRDGYTINVRSGRDYDNLDNWSGRASALFRPNDRIESLTVFDAVTAKDNGTGSQLTYVRTAPDARGGTVPTAGNPAVGYGPFLPGILAQQIALGPRKVVGSSFDTVRGATRLPWPGQQEMSKLWNYGIINKTTAEIGELTFKNIFGYRHIELRRFNDFHHMGLIGLTSQQSDRYSIYSNEMQLIGQAFDDRLDWQTGLFGISEKGAEFSHSTQFNDFSLPLAQFISLTGNERFVRGNAISYAVFGYGTYKLTDHWKLSGGLRWNHDQRSVETHTHTTALRNLGAQPAPNCVHTGVSPAQTVSPIDTCKLDNGAAWRSLTWDVTLAWQPTTDTNVYVAQRKGFRSGGFSTRSTDPRTLLPFNPEFTRETEFGVKQQWPMAGGTLLTTNAAVFYQDLKNVQVQLATIVGTTIQTVIVNTGAQKNYGADFEATLSVPMGPAGALDVGAFFAYVNVADTVNRPFNALYGVPKAQVGGSAEYTLPFDESVGRIAIGGDLNYKSLIHLDDSDPNADQGGYALTNFYLNWDEVYGTGLGLGLFVTNAFNRTYRQGGVFLDDVIAANSNMGVNPPGSPQTGSNLGLSASIYGEPRMFGGSVSYKF